MLGADQLAGLQEQVARRGTRWGRFLEDVSSNVHHSRGAVVHGVLTRLVGMTMEATGCQAAVGGRCVVQGRDGTEVETEVVGFAGGALLLMPTGPLHGMMPGARVVPSGRVFEARVGEEILGRVLDGAGQPIDGGGPVSCEERLRLTPKTLNPLARAPITEPLDVGVRSINGLLTVGRGQRLGLFAGSGVGKSMLLGMMTRFTNADVIVVGLIGERGREVQEFVAEFLDSAARRRAVVIATPADYPPLVRAHGALLATSIAEYFRDRGCHVLLLMDSLTRFAQAQREIALAIGEPPVTKGYPPSVFAKLPQLVERAGNGGPLGGSITAFYTVLTESDDPNDPVADASRAVLDGHIVLSRVLAEAGLYPAVDVEASISRATQTITTPEHRERIRRFRQLNSTYAQNRDLITVGAYARGSDRRVDEAVDHWPRMLGFLHQEASEPVSLSESIAALGALFETPSQAKAGQDE
jgi:flagellum-specific ATP synthase